MSSLILAIILSILINEPSYCKNNTNYGSKRITRKDDYVIYQLKNGIILKIKGLKNFSPAILAIYLVYIKSSQFSDNPILNKSETISNMISSGAFSEVSLSQDGNVITFIVQENHIISKIDRETLPLDVSKKFSQQFPTLKEGEFLDKKVIQEAVQWISEQLQEMGYFNAEVKTEIKVEKGKARVYIKTRLGSKAEIKSIAFNYINNDNISNDKTEKYHKGNDMQTKSELKKERETLLKIIPLSSKKWYSFLTNSHLPSMKKIEYSCMIIKVFYNKMGFFESKVSCTAVLEKNNTSASLNYSIEKGPQFTISDVIVKINDNECKKLTNKFTNQYKMTNFSEKRLNELVAETKKVALSDEVIRVDYSMDIDYESKTVSIEINANSEKNFNVEKVLIHGNKNISTIFIRENIGIAEGMRYKEISPSEIQSQLMSTEFFTNVKVNLYKGNSKNSKIVVIEVTEKANVLMLVGTIAVSAREGLSGEIGYRAKKEALSASLLGKITKTSKMFKLSIDNNAGKHCIDKQIEFVLDESDASELITNAAQDKVDKKASLRTKSFSLNGNLLFPVSYPFYYGIGSKAGFQQILKNGRISDIFTDGSWFVGNIMHTIKLNTLNNNIIPISGLCVSLSNAFCVSLPLGSTISNVSKTAKTTIEATLFIPIVKSHMICISFSGKIGILKNLSKQPVNVFDKFFSSDTQLHGFSQQSGIGPKNHFEGNYESIGGTEFVSFFAGIWLPITKTLFEMYGIRLCLFINGGSVHNSGITDDKYKILADDCYIRSAAGIGFCFALGPGCVMISFTQVLNQHETDIASSISFNIPMR